MKKIYNSPTTEAIKIEALNILAGTYEGGSKSESINVGNFTGSSGGESSSESEGPTFIDDIPYGD